MSRRDVRKWVEGLDGANLNAIETAELDELLATPKQQVVNALVAALPEENVSLQWRSSLNEKLRAMTPVRKHVSFMLIGFRTLAGIGLASLLCIAFYTKFGGGASAPANANPEASAPQKIGSALISAHRESVTSSEIAGPGIADGEADSKKSASDSSDSGDPDLDLS